MAPAPVGASARLPGRTASAVRSAVWGALVLASGAWAAPPELAAPVRDRLEPGAVEVIARLERLATTLPAAEPLTSARRDRLRSASLTRDVDTLEPVILAGRLEQRRALPPRPGGEPVAEWFVRLPDGEPVVVLVAGETVPSFEPGLGVRAIALPAGTITVRARDDRDRTYLAFVARAPTRFAARGGATGLLLVLAPVLLVLLVLAAIAAWLAARASRGRPGRRLDREAPGDRDDGVGSEGETPPDDSLPADPADALATLESRARRGGPRA